MKVCELIAILQECPADMDVLLSTREGYFELLGVEIEMVDRVESSDYRGVGFFPYHKQAVVL